MSRGFKVSLFLIALLVMFGTGVWWVWPTAPMVAMHFVEFRNTNGIHGATFRLENCSQDDFWCVSGDPTSPDLWVFAPSGAEKAVDRASPNPATANNKDNIHFIKPGARSDLWMPLRNFNGVPLTQPFRIGIFLQSPRRIRNWKMLEWLQFPKRIFGPNPVIVMSDVVSP